VPKLRYERKREIDGSIPAKDVFIFIPLAISISIRAVQDIPVFENDNSCFNNCRKRLDLNFAPQYTIISECVSHDHSLSYSQLRH
jgi:hypothetical protein